MSIDKHLITAAIIVRHMVKVEGDSEEEKRGFRRGLRQAARVLSWFANGGDSSGPILPIAFVNPRRGRKRRTPCRLDL